MEPSRERPSLAGRLGIEIRAAIRDDERVGKHAAKHLEIARRLIARIAHVHGRELAVSREQQRLATRRDPLDAQRGPLWAQSPCAGERRARASRRNDAALRFGSSMSAGSFRHRAWSSPSGLCSGHAAVRVAWIVARYRALRPASRATSFRLCFGFPRAPRCSKRHAARK